MTTNLSLNQEIILSDGENLSLALWDRLMALRGNANKLAAKLGRTDHYARKNRSAIERIDDDLRKVDEEIKRRMALTTISFCGLTFHYQGRFEQNVGEYDRLDEIPEDRRADAVQVRIEAPVLINTRTGEKTPLGPATQYWAIREQVLILVRVPTASNFSARRKPSETIHVTLAELREYIGRGAIKTTALDPCAPWKVLAEEPGENL